MNSPILTLKNVGCRYSYKAGLFKSNYYDALKAVSFDVYREETIGVVGRNGAGKSTLLRLIAGIIDPDVGEIIRPTNLSISLLTLQLGFSVELSGYDNAILSAMLFGHSRQRILEKIDQIKHFSELGDWFHKPIKSYSSGMRARLGFAVAMEMSPDILLVDEVLGVGDEAFREKSTQAMKDKMKSGQTIIFVSHHSHIVKDLCSSLVWIEDGISKKVGPTEEVLPEYQAWIQNNFRR